MHNLYGDVGFYTANNKRELFYTDSENNISKYSMDRKTTTTFIQATDKTCRFCVCTGPLCQENFWLECMERSRVHSN